MNGPEIASTVLEMTRAFQPLNQVSETVVGERGDSDARRNSSAGPSPSFLDLRHSEVDKEKTATGSGSDSRESHEQPCGHGEGWIHTGYSARGEWAAGLGFEPRTTDPESVVLPLHHPAMVRQAHYRREAEALQSRFINHRHQVDELLERGGPECAGGQALPWKRTAAEQPSGQ